VKSDPCTEENCRQAAPYYTPNSSAVIKVVARGVGARFNERDRTRVTSDITLGNEIDEKYGEHPQIDGRGGEERG
jgi:hypothetical protein